MLLAVSLSLVLAAYLLQRSSERTVFDGLRRQLALLSQEDLRIPQGSLGRFLASQDERVSILPKKQASLLLPPKATGRIVINRQTYVYASRTSNGNVIVLLRTASSVRAERRPFWIAFVAAGALGCFLAAVLGSLLARSISRPVRAVAGASARLARGEVLEPLPLAGSQELCELAASFNMMAADLERARRAEHSFLLSTSHELKTPLTAIRGYAEALEEGVLTPTRATRVIRTEAARLERLIADLINLARLDQLRFDVRVEPLDLNKIVAETAARHYARARELKVNLGVRSSPEPAPAVADPDRLLQVLSNLVENALRCTPPGRSVTLIASPATVIVEDAGPGIADEEIPHTFERFFLYRRYAGRRPVGTGLGLAIVRELVQAMGGEVEVASSPHGTQFITRLPLPERAVA